MLRNLINHVDYLLSRQVLQDILDQDKIDGISIKELKVSIDKPYILGSIYLCLIQDIGTNVDTQI